MPPARRAVAPPPSPSRRGAPPPLPADAGRARLPAPGAPSRQAPAQRPNRRGPSSSSGQRAAAARGRQKAAWSRLAPVYDVDGPRIRFGLAWFAVALPAIALSTTSSALLYALAGGLAARQVVKAWKSESWQADAAAAAAAVPVLAAVGGTGAAIAAIVLGTALAVVVGLSAPVAGLRGNVGRIAGAGVMIQATVPIAVAGAAMVLLRGEAELMTAVILFVLACSYEMGDFLVGSGSSNPVEGPMAGGAAVMVIGFPLALVLIPPFDVLGVAMLAVTAAACPVGQWIASAILPRPDAHAPALRRIDTLLLLAPLWAIATGVI